jgi:Beta propeller domain
VRGELKIPGYSAYLHPVGDDLLLGVGQEADAQGRVRGLQLSLFDVSDLARPVRLQKAQIAERWSSSEVEWDHHAFLWWPATNVAVLPIDSRDFRGAAGYRVQRAGGIAEIGRITHPGPGSWTPPVSRSVVVGDRLFTISEFGARASGLETLADRGWVAFPQPPAPPEPKPEAVPLR